MGLGTEISWCDATWNPWRGCKKISAGCANCYIDRVSERWGWDPERVVRSKSTFLDPLKWIRQGKLPAGANVFTCSLSYFFIPEADAWRDEAWDVIRCAGQLRFLILTKRPELAAKRLPADWGEGYRNVILGVTVEKEDYLSRIAAILDVPAEGYFISAEPLLGPINIEMLLLERGARTYARGGVVGVVAGGETGESARPTHPAWVREIRDACDVADVPFTFKQWGEWAPCNGFAGLRKPGAVVSLDGQHEGMMTRTGRRRAGGLLDGRTHKEREKKETK